MGRGPADKKMFGLVGVGADGWILTVDFRISEWVGGNWSMNFTG